MIASSFISFNYELSLGFVNCKLYIFTISVNVQGMHTNYKLQITNYKILSYGSSLRKVLLVTTYNPTNYSESNLLSQAFRVLHGFYDKIS